MYIYANGFTIAVSENKNEYMLSFRQIHPSIDPQGNVKENISESVADVVMSKDGFIALCTLLKNSDTLE